MQHFDIESSTPDNILSAQDDNDNENVSVFPVTRSRQTSRLALCLAVCLFGAVALVLSKTYTSASQIPTDIAFDADGGHVGNDATNAVRSHHSSAETGASPSNPFHAPHQSRDDYLDNQQQLEGGGGFNQYHANRTKIKQQTVLEKWNRLHPGEPLPNKFIYSLPTGTHAYETRPMDIPGKYDPRYPDSDNGGASQFFPTKTHHDDPQVEDSSHELDVHNDETSPPAEHEVETFPVTVAVGVIAPTAAPVDEVTPKPIAAAPMDQPSPKPTTAAPVEQPSPKPTTPAPVDQPSPKPTAAAPVNEPTPKPTTAAPVNEPTPKPTTAASVDEPTPKPTTAAPVDEPTSKPTTAAPIDPPPDTKQPTEEVVSNSSTSSSSSSSSSNSRDAEIAAWHAATVTTDSGVMFEIVDQLRHDHAAFTQGLTFANGKLYESAGLYGQSSVRILDPNTGDAKQIVKVDGKFFAEGMTFYKDKLVQIVWKKATGFVYDAHDIAAPPITYTYETTKDNEGWGLTYDYDRGHLVVTDGSANLIFWDPDCWQTGHCAPVADRPPVQVTRLDGSPAEELNEIEYWRGRVLANIWYSDVLLVINPDTGRVEKEYGKCSVWVLMRPLSFITWYAHFALLYYFASSSDFGSIYPKRNSGADVFNGISVSDDPDVLYVTGKKWDRIFKVKLLT